MAKSVSAAQARNNFADMIGAAHFGNEIFVIERLGKPFAVIMGFEHYQRLLEAQQRRERQARDKQAAEQQRLL